MENLNQEDNLSLQQQEEEISKTENEALENSDESAKPDRVFLQEDVNKIVSERLANERKKSEKLLEKQIEDAVNEAKRSTETSLFEESERRMREVEQRELAIYAAESLAKKSLPSTLAQVLKCDSYESIDKSLADIEGAWRAAVQESVEQRLASKSPIVWERSLFDERLKRAMGL